MADKQLVDMIMSGEGEDADLQDAILTGANLRYAELTYAYLEGANLSNANLQNANLQRANLRDANLQDANLKGADLKDADLTGAYLIGVEYDAQTKWPRGFTPPGGGGRMASYDPYSKRIRPNAKEIARSDGDYTVVSRPQSDGTILVAAVTVPDGQVISYDIAESKMEVGYKIKQLLRNLHKLALGGGMAESSRHRTRPGYYQGTPPGEDGGGGRMASRSRKASTMVPIKISSVSHKSKFPFDADNFHRNPDESIRRAANRFLESVKNESLYCTVNVDGEMHTTVPITVGSFDTTKIVSKLQNAFSRLGSRIPDQGKGTITFDFKFVPFSGNSEMLVDIDEMASDDMLNLMAKSDITLDVSIKTTYGDVWSMSVEDSPVAYFDLEISVPEILSYRN